MEEEADQEEEQALMQRYETVGVFASLRVMFIPTRRVGDVLQLECLGQTRPHFLEDMNIVAGRRRHMGQACAQVRALSRSGAHMKRATTASVLAAKAAGDTVRLVKEEAERRRLEQVFAKINWPLSESIFFLTEEENVTDALQCSQSSDERRQQVARQMKYIDATVRLQESLDLAGYRVEELT